MTARKTKSFRHPGAAKKAVEETAEQTSEATAPDQPTSFWRRLFGGKPVPKEKLSKGKAPKGADGAKGGPAAASQRAGQLAAAGASRGEARQVTAPIAPLQADGRPRNPKSFLAKKFNSQVVKAALLDAIGEAMDNAPPGIDPIEAKFWIEGLAFKGILVEQLDCSQLKPEEHLRAIQWMAKVERLHPLKSTYREDLFASKYQLGVLHLKEPPDAPDAVGQGGIALRKLYQVMRTKLEGLGKLGADQSLAAQRELAAYERLMDAIERAPLAKLERADQLRASNVYRRIDPYRMELTSRHARFEENIEALIRELDEVYEKSTT
jgi:hypothetical protein